MSIDVSVIIPNFNGEKFIANCIDSLLAQCYNDTMEIIVVDDCSADSSREIIKKYHQVKLIENQENYGFAKSVNRGICASKGKFCLLLNNDVVVEPKFVHALYKHILKRRDAFSVSSKMIRYYERNKLDDTGDFYNIFGWAYKRGDGKAVESFEESTQVFSACAGAAIYRRSVLNEIGMFDESFFAYLEDVDLSYRGLINGYSNYYAPEAVCYHIGSATTADGQKYSSFKVKISARNNVYLAYKNMPILQLLINSPFLFTGFLLKWARFAAGGYGKCYLEGVKEGFASLDNVSKVKFRPKNLFNYLRIEGLMIMNLPKQVLLKLGK